MDYAIEFHTLAAESGWNQPALVDAFYNGLTDSLKDHLTPLDLPTELDALVLLTSRVDKRLIEQQRTRLQKQQHRPTNASSLRPPPDVPRETTPDRKLAMPLSPCRLGTHDSLHQKVNGGSTKEDASIVLNWDTSSSRAY